MPSQKLILTKRVDVSNDSNMNIEKEKVSGPETRAAVTQVLTSIARGKTVGDTDRDIVNDKNIYAVPQGSRENLQFSRQVNSPLTATANANTTPNGTAPDAIPTLNWSAVLQEMDTTGKNITNIYEMDGQNILWISPKQYSLLHAAMHTAYEQNSGIGWKISARLIEIQPLLVKCKLGISGEYPIVTAIEKYSSGNRKPEFYVFLSSLLRSSLELLPYIPTLIHLAFKKGVPHDIAVYLLRANSKACSVFDEDGFLPLHRLCDTTGVIDTVLLDEVMRIEPRAVVVKTKTKPFLTPMQLLQRNNATVTLDELRQGQLSTMVHEKAIDLSGKDDQTTVSTQVFHTFPNKNSSPRGNISIPGVPVDGDIKMKDKSEVIDLLDDSDDEADDKFKSSSFQPSVEPVHELKSLHSLIKIESPALTHPRHDSTTMRKNTSKRTKTSDLKTQKLVMLQNLDKEIQMYRNSAEKFSAKFKHDINVCRRSAIDVPEQALISQALRNLRKDSKEGEPNGAEQNENLFSIEPLKKTEQQLAAKRQMLELKRNETSMMHEKKLNSIRDCYSTKLSTRFKTYRQQIQASQENHEKELDKLKIRIIAIQKTIMADFGGSDDDELLAHEVESQIKHCIDEQKTILQAREEELVKHENRKKKIRD